MLNLRYLLFLCCLVAAVAADKYSDKYDNVNIDEILENRRLLQGYVDCVLERGKCTPDGKELKDHLSEALETGCEKCTEHQMANTQKVFNHLIKNEKGFWKELCDKFDPEGKYRKKYETIAKEHGIDIE